jgi:hypothetical protein
MAKTLKDYGYRKVSLFSDCNRFFMGMSFTLTGSKKYTNGFIRKSGYIFNLLLMQQIKIQ